jgi:hypothetical protein
MCRECHMHIPDDIMLEQLSDTLKNPHFKLWNTTSLSHILIAIEGYNGEKVHKIALILAEGFYEWYLGLSHGVWQHFYKYKPKYGMECFPHSTEIRKMIDDSLLIYENKHKKQD